MSSEHWDVIVIGGGVVGAAVARELQCGGKRVLLCEKEDDFLSDASGGNTGHLATFFYYTRARAVLEGEMAARARRINPGWLAGQPGVPCQQRGMLLLARGRQEEAVEELLQLAEGNGQEVRRIPLEEARSLEPHVCFDGVTAALLAPDEAMVDPWLLAMSHVWGAEEAGAELRTGCEVLGCRREGDRWVVSTVQGEVTADIVINCAGNNGDNVDRMAGQDPQFNIRPGKGEFLVFDRRPDGTPWVSRPLVPVPSSQTAGLYIFPTVYGHTVVGPTNVLQDSRTDRSVSRASQAALLQHAYRLVPGLVDCPPLGMWAGLRPATQHQDYCIKFRPDQGWVTVAGIRSTGLSCSLAISQYVAESLLPHYQPAPVKEMPPVNVENGRLRIGQRTYTPTHPQTRLGLLGLSLPLSLSLPPPLPSLL